MQTYDPVQRHELDRRATAAVALALARDSYLSDVDDIPGEMRRRGFGAFATKAAVDPLVVTDPALVNRGDPIVAAFVGAVDRQSLLGPLQASGAIVSPLQASESVIVLGTITGHSVGEGEPKPVSEVALSTAGTPAKAVAMVVITSEAARATSAAIQDGIRAALASAVATEVDAALIDALTAAPGSPGPTADVGALLGSISGGAPAKPVIILGWDLIESDMANWRALGVPILPSGAAAGKMIAVDAARLAIADGGAELVTARHATIALDDAGAGAAT